MSNLLLLSNSTNYGESYMDWCKSVIADFVADAKQNIVFVPYAAVGFSYDTYTQKVNDALAEVNIKVQNLDNFTNKQEAIENCSAIFVGGGNTFHLLKQLQDLNVIEAIRSKVGENTPYVGWSAGSNLASPTICTTNDMPIVEPDSFEALSLVNFQINPHYTEKTITDHGGESRLQRLKEYVAANQKSKVICLPESGYVHVEGSESVYYGEEIAKSLSYDGEEEIVSGGNL